ncbi:uncharacterized protein LOC109863731 [Pseudomyrmex gracilis]|uniref:uncharacterized protein LOC109863731 n=1 Tax=Pseudomyrmex gracilis TaxID=219809 RepID=UPI000995AAC2|nr:uncharacterized protein LOC109863731 [Pseudomyrmex gracilis]
MAMSTKLLKRLNSGEDPLPKRLKLAETAFVELDLPLVKKDELLLEWVCKTCLTNQEAWKTLNEFLKSRIDIKTNAKQCLIDTLVQKLNTDERDINKEFLQCCDSVLSNNSMRQYFTNNPQNLGVLLRALLNNFLKYSEIHSHCCNTAQNELEQQLKPNRNKWDSNGIFIFINSTLRYVVKSLTQIYQQSVTRKDELREIFMHDVLHLVCNSIDESDYKGSFIASDARECIQQILLNKSRFTENKRMGEESRQAVLSNLSYVLSRNVRASCPQSNLLTYKFLFYTVVDSCKSDAVLLDMVFRKLIESSGKHKFEILEACLRYLNDVTLDFDNTIDGVTLSEYLQKIITDILAFDNLRDVLLYKILKNLAYINPILIEKNIPDILNKTLMEEQNVDYINLLNALLYCSMKLRREQKFISQLLASLKETIKVKQSYEIKRQSFFPYEFKSELTKQINNFSSSQIITTLRTIIHYLNTDCVTLLESNISCKYILMLKATVELLLMFFSNIQILEHIKLPIVFEKLVNSLEDLSNTLSLLINKALCLSYNKDIIVLLLNAVQSLSDMQNVLKYYVPKEIAMKQLAFPIPDDPWQQLIQRISNFGKRNCKYTMNKLILHRIRSNISRDSSSFVKLSGLVGGLEYSWNIILKYYTDVLSLLHDNDVITVTYFFLTYITSNENNYDSWHVILKRECLQENRQFVHCLLGQILAQIGQCTKSITVDITPELMLEKENDNKLLDILQVMKEQISQDQWIQMTNSISDKIRCHLKVLLNLPIIHFRCNVKLLVFLVVYSVSKECDNNAEILSLCNKIFLDLLEDTRIDIFQYIEPTAVINQLSQNKAFAKACEYHLSDATTYATLKSLIKSCARNKEAMCIILEYLETIKPNDTEQKVIFRKARKKLATAILKKLPEAINEAFDVRCLVAVLKISSKNITDDLKKLTESTHNNIFTTEENLKTAKSALVQQGVELAVIVLQRRKTFEVPDTTIKGLWRIMLRYPYKNLFKPLLASTGEKEFYELLKLLHDETITIWKESDETAWKNLFFIWNGVMKTEYYMNTRRKKMRWNAFNNLLFRVVFKINFPPKYWSHVVSLSHNIIATKHLLIPNTTFDLIIITALHSLPRALHTQQITVCECVLALCKTMIKVRPDMITDRLPNLLLLYRNVIEIVVHGSRYFIDNNKIVERRFRCLAFDIEKFTSLLIKLKKDMIRLSPYVIADLLQIITDKELSSLKRGQSEYDLSMKKTSPPYPSFIKVALHNSLYQLISICDQHAIAFLSRTLPVSLQEVFKVQLDSFNKFYKYSGKV